MIAPGEYPARKVQALDGGESTDAARYLLQLTPERVRVFLETAPSIVPSELDISQEVHSGAVQELD